MPGAPCAEAAGNPTALNTANSPRSPRPTTAAGHGLPQAPSDRSVGRLVCSNSPNRGLNGTGTTIDEEGWKKQ